MNDYSQEDVAFIDFDFRRTPPLRPVYFVARLLGLRVLWIRTDRTAKGWHIVVKLSERLQKAELISFQAACGDDGRRVALNLMRVVNIRKFGCDPFWEKRWNILFSRKITR